MRNAQHGLSARQQFRQAGRRVLNAPADLALHEQRVNAALGLEGVEPLQGALADWLHGCAPDAARFQALLARADIQPRLAPFVLQGLQAQAASGRKLPAASVWATRWSVLVAPSLDVPRRALLCSVDDSRRIAAEALPALLAGDAQAEQDFLAHCEGAGDSLGFMLVRRALTREGRALSPQWEAVSLALQNGVIQA